MLPLNSRIRLDIGDFHIRELLHTDPASTIVQVENLVLGRIEALKIFHDPNEYPLEVIQQEARAIGGLQHPSNLRLLGVGAFDAGSRPQSCMVLEHVQGTPLTDMLQAGRLSTLQACRLIAQLLEAVSEAHDAGLVYGSLSPNRLTVSANGHYLKIADYGLRRSRPKQAQADVAHLFSHEPFYLAPERFFGRPLAPKGDLFSIGVLFYEMLSGQRPFSGEGFELLGQYQHQASPTPLHQHLQLPEPLYAIVERALQLDPDRRYASTLAMLRALQTLRMNDLVAYSARPITEQATLHDPPSFPLAPPTPDGMPEIWVLQDDPAFRHDRTVKLLSRLTRRYRIKHVGNKEGAALAKAISARKQHLPWVVLFGDLHVIINNPLLAVLRGRSELSRVLVSTHLNAEMMHATINACSLDQQLLCTDEPLEMEQRIRAMVERTRSIRNRHRQRSTPFQQPALTESSVSQHNRTHHGA